MSGIRVDQNILNQRGTPAFNAGIFATRPAAGFVGRIFISTNTYQIFRDEGTGWSLISDAGSGSSNLEQVTLNGNNTPYGINITSGGLFLLGTTNGSIFFADGGSGQFTTDATTLFWDNTNKRLGLGTATPGAKLDIHSSSGTTATFNGTGSTNAVTSYQSAGTSKWSIGNYVSSAVANDFCIYDNVNTAYRLYVHNTGVINIPTSLIIGSTTPTSSYTFDVNGSGNFTSSLLVGTTITANSFIPNGATIPTNGMYLSAANTLNFATNSTANRLTILSNGRVGIGTATPADKLNVSNSGAEGLEIGFNTNQTYIISYNRTTAAANPLLLQPSSGNVLIGTTTDAGQKLQVNGSSKFSGTITSDSQITQTGAGVIQLYNDTNTNYWWTRVLASASNNYRFNYNGTDKAEINNSTGVFIALSNINHKKDFELSTIGLDAILGLKPTLYRMKSEDNTEKHLGLIAQEVKDYIPQAYIENGVDFIGLDYQAITSTLIKAIQDLNEKLIRNNIN